MRLKEIAQPSDQRLFEELDQVNDTGFLTEDLVRITRAKDSQWSQPMTGAQLLEQVRNIYSGSTE